MHSGSQPTRSQSYRAIADLEMHVDRQDTFTLTLYDSSEEVCQGVEKTELMLIW